LRKRFPLAAKIALLSAGASARDNVDLDHRRLIHAQHLIGIEIGLLHTTVSEGDFAIERRGNAEDDPALNLRPYNVGIYDGATINRADNAPDTDRPVLRHFHFGDLGHVVGEGVLEGDPAANPVR
jgi:hypothetical protein